jgi:hypothetical protein
MANRNRWGYVHADPSLYDALDDNPIVNTEPFSLVHVYTPTWPLRCPDALYDDGVRDGTNNVVINHPPSMVRGKEVRQVGRKKETATREVAVRWSGWVMSSTPKLMPAGIWLCGTVTCGKATAEFTRTGPEFGKWKTVRSQYYKAEVLICCIPDENWYGQEKFTAADFVWRWVPLSSNTWTTATISWRPTGITRSETGSGYGWYTLDQHGKPAITIRDPSGQIHSR